MASTESDLLRGTYQGWTDAMAAEPDMELSALRDLFENWHTPTAEPIDVTYREVVADGVPALCVSPLDATSDRVFLYTHGGGFVVGSINTHRKLAGHLAKAAGCHGLVIDYRRAPEHPFPAQLSDSITAYRWLRGQGFPSNHIFTAGDSAGGNLSISTVLKLREDGDTLPAAIVAMSPWLDMQHEGKTLDSNAATDALVQRPLLEGMSSMFLGEAEDSTDPLANPLHADLTGLPPVFVTAGGYETLLDNSERFAERARAAGVDVHLDIVPEMQHVFTISAGRAPEADATIDAAARWVRPHIGLG